MVGIYVVLRQLRSEGDRIHDSGRQDQMYMRPVRIDNGPHTKRQEA